MNRNFAFVVDRKKKPLSPVSAVKARRLLDGGKAAVFRRYPFVIILKKEVTATIEPTFQLRIDPGSKFTGFAIADANNRIIWGMELEHRGQQIKSDLEKRAGFRRTRRSRKTRYRKCRFNRNKPEGWLAPSLRHRLETTMTWVNRVIRYAPIGSIAMELVKFDMQKMQNSEISSVEYQQGDLQGYEVREYLLEKWGRKCAYCGKTDTPLEVEHIHPKSKGGSNRVSNLTLACHGCNQRKGSRDVADFLSGKPDVLKRIKAQQKKPLADAAAVNATRNAIVNKLETTELPVTTGTGAHTKWARTQLNDLRAAHWIDAACVATDEPLELLTEQPLRVTCKGHGTRQMVRCNAFGFPALKIDKKDPSKNRPIAPKKKYTHALVGDIVRVTLTEPRRKRPPKGEKRSEIPITVPAGEYVARVKTPTTKGVEVKINDVRVTCKPSEYELVFRGDGYDYRFDTK